MSEHDFLHQLEHNGGLIPAAAVGAGWDAPVPGLTWDARTVVTHLGAVHRWCADIVSRRLATNLSGGSSAFWPSGIGDDELLGWFATGLGELVETLRAAPVDLNGYTMLDDVPARDFWLRRQAHETAIHRADVQAAAGLTPTQIVADLPAAFAQTGLVELVGGFVREPAFAADRSCTVLLEADDGPSWRVTFSPDGNRAESAQDAAELDRADATASGSSAQLYLWAWNRPADVTTTGDPVAVEQWRRRVVIS